MFSYYRKGNEMNYNIPVENENLEDIKFTPFTNIEQFKKYDEKPLTFPEIPFFAIYYFVDTLMRTGFKDSWFLYFPLTILAVINYFIVRQRKLKFKKYCLGFTVSKELSQIEKISDLYLIINCVFLFIAIPMHLWQIVTNNTKGSLFDLCMLVLLIVCSVNIANGKSIIEKQIN